MARPDDEHVVPVMAESVHIGTRTVARDKVRVVRKVIEEPQTVDVPLRYERLEIERVQVDLVVERAPPVRQEGETLIVPCVEEILVVEKRLRVREELRIRKITEERRETHTVVLRRHEVEVISETPDEGTTSADPPPGAGLHPAPPST